MIWTMIKDHIFTSTSLTIIAGILITFIGCQPTTESIITPGKQVSRSELQAELNLAVADYEAKTKHIIALAESRNEKIIQQEQFWAWVGNELALYAQTGTVNPIGIIAGLFGLLGVGAACDNVKQRLTIKNLKNGSSSCSSTNTTPTSPSDSTTTTQPLSTSKTGSALRPALFSHTREEEEFTSSPKVT